MNMLAFAPTDETPKEAYWSRHGWQVSKLIWIPTIIVLIATMFCWAVFFKSGLLRYIENAKRDETEKSADSDSD